MPREFVLSCLRHNAALGGLQSTIDVVDLLRCSCQSNVESPAESSVIHDRTTLAFLLLLGRLLPRLFLLTLFGI